MLGYMLLRGNLLLVVEHFVRGCENALILLTPNL